MRPRSQAERRRELGADVPRRAVFDDLRVGQWVAWIDDIASVGYAARVTKKTADGANAVSNIGVELKIHPDFEVTILRDAPAPPVTVRRDLLDELRERHHEYGANAVDKTLCATCRFLAAVDADLGDTP